MGDPRNPATLGNNLFALERVQPDFARAVASASPDPRITVQPGRDRAPGILASRDAENPPVQLHSRYRPDAEAVRMATAIGPAATLVVFGAGGLFLPRYYLERYETASVLVAEPDISTLRAIFETLDLTPMIASRRVRFVTTPEELGTSLQAIHLPALHDGIRTWELRPWCEWEPQRTAFAAMREALSRGIASIAAELATMRRFGRPWLAHAVANSFHTPWETVPQEIARLRADVTGRHVIVAAAGPGLDEARFPDGVPVIAVDTALPALRGRGVSPALVVSLDAQGWSALHMRPRRDVASRHGLLAADLSVSPALLRNAGRVVPIGSNHPLHRLMGSAGFPLLFLPATTIVTETAIRLAWWAGASRIDLVGADFGYPRAKSYARGTYHYYLADASARRLRPSETFFADQVYPATELSAGSGEGDAPFFSKTGMEDARTRTTALLASGASEGVPELPFHPLDRSGVVRFWRSHLEVLESLSPVIGEADTLSTPVLLERLGLHGRAHLPVCVALERRLTTRADAGETRGERLSALFTDVRGFIFSRLRRYSK